MDMFFDYFELINPVHYVAEVFPLISLTLLLFYLIKLQVKVGKELARWKKRANYAILDAEKWKGQLKDLTEGSGYVIDQQFDKWEFTKDEKEIGILLL